MKSCDHGSMIQLNHGRNWLWWCGDCGAVKSSEYWHIPRNELRRFDKCVQDTERQLAEVRELMAIPHKAIYMRKCEGLRIWNAWTCVLGWVAHKHAHECSPVDANVRR